LLLKDSASCSFLVSYTTIFFCILFFSICLIYVCNRHFLLVEKSSLSLYSYEGRLLCSPRWQGMQPEILNPACVSISSDTIAVRDQADEKCMLISRVQNI
jgi:intraflagellar transport protein 80